MAYLLAQGDCLERLREIPDASIDAICADPPAGIVFMGKEWDKPDGVANYNVYGGSVGVAAPRIGQHKGNRAEHLRARGQFIAGMTAVFVECLRVLKPGGHAIVWGIPRTVHWTTTALEDAGFEIRDVLGHMFLNGWPKTRTILKPSREDWILCRKPLIGTVAANVQKYGTGGLNIDASRVATAPGDDVEQHGRGGESAKSKGIYGDSAAAESGQSEGQKLGRWPPNTVFSHGSGCVRTGTATVAGHKGYLKGPGGKGIHYMSEARSTDVRPAPRSSPVTNTDGTETVAVWNCEPGCPVAALDAQSGAKVGASAPVKGTEPSDPVEQGGITQPRKRVPGAFHKDKGGASRMFPVFDWSTEQDEVDETEAGVISVAGLDPAVYDPFRYFAKPSPTERAAGLPPKGNTHPTVKNIALMRWLVKLVTPPGGVVLDPFMGSGTTGCAAVLEGFEFLGIEREAEYVAIARARIGYWFKRGAK
jgi:site-specific DNA-methyltransferase (adenine-specific)